MNNEAQENVAARIERIAPGTVLSEARMESVRIAVDSGVDDETLRRIVTATRLKRDTTVILPAHRFEGLSRGRGWCRLGSGVNVQWGERTNDGYRVGPGRWTVGATDGFSRKKSETWTVSAIQVGNATWTIAS